ncbi:MAG: flagellin [Ignavibacteriales bacterium]
MRITDSILASNFISSLNKSKEGIQTLQTRIATGSKINNPSDSPSGISKVLKLQEQIQSGESFVKNVENGQAFMQTTTSSMENIADKVQDTLVLFTETNNPVNASNFKSYAAQIDQVLSSLMDVANSEFDGKYVFGGTDFSTTTKPYGFTTDINGNKAVELKVGSNSGEQKVRISKNMELTMNVPGSNVFPGVPSTGNGDVTSTDIFNTLLRVKTNLENGIIPADSDVNIVKDFQTNLAGQLTTAGDTLNRLDSTHELLDNQQLELKKLLSNEKDVDVAQSVVDLQNQQYFLELSYKMSSMILPKSLLDYV